VKKTLSTVLAILLTLGTLCAFAACGDKTDNPATDPEITETDPDTTAVVVDPSETEPPTETEPATEPPTETETETATGNDPTTMDKKLLLEYFNTAVNAVREKKPKFDYVLIRKMDKVETTILGGAVDGIINSVVKSLMPGDPETGTVQKGAGNHGKFLSDSETKASLLTLSQMSSITAAKEGANYKITVKVPPATNPSMTAGQSGYSSLHQIQDPKSTVEAIVGDNGAIKADPAKTTLNYKNGYVTIVVNAAGQVQSMDGGFNVDAVGKDWSVSILKGDVTAMQSTSVKASNFVW
jgi:hypothetical protein